MHEKWVRTQSTGEIHVEHGGSHQSKSLDHVKDPLELVKETCGLLLASEETIALDKVESDHIKDGVEQLKVPST